MRRLFPDNRLVEPRWGTGLRLAVGEAPGEEEARQGEPFVGGSGAWLRGRQNGPRRQGGFYGAAHVADNSLTFVNVIQCRPPGNVFPTDAKARSYISAADAETAVNHCVKAHLEPVLRARAWTRIDLFGDKALRAVTGRRESITELRGTPLPVPAIDGTKPLAVPTFHPSYVARDQTMIPVVVNDLLKDLRPMPELFTLFPTLDQVREFTATTFAFDIETAPNGDITMVGLSARPYHALVVPFSGEYKAELRRIFLAADTLIGQNIISFDIPRLYAALNIEWPQCQIYDLMLMHGLLYPDFPHSLDFIGRQFTNIGAWKQAKANMELYNARDVSVTFLCFQQMLPALQREGLVDLYALKSVPLQLICDRMQRIGMRCDPRRLEEVRGRVLREMAELEAALPEPLRTHKRPVRRRQLAPPGTVSTKTGKPVKYIMVPDEETICPWRSSQEKIKYLYGTLGLAQQYNPKDLTKITVDKGALDKLIRRHGTQYPWLAKLKKLNKLATLESGFLDTERGLAGRIHPRFNVVGTSEGRLSSAGPNFQNQPPAARYMYVPDNSEQVLINCDYRGIEGRLTAFFSRDTARLDRMADPNFNEYKWAINKIDGTPLDEIEKDNSVDAPYGLYKRIILGMGYGLGARKIANQYGLSEATVKRLMFEIKAQAFPEMARWQEQVASQAKRDGFLRNPFGRKRWFWTDSSYGESLAFLPASTAADVIFNAMIGLMYEHIGWPADKAVRVSPVLRPLPREVELLVQVHDALMFKCPRRLVDQVIPMIREVMTQPWAQLGGFSLPVAVETGFSWGELEEYDDSKQRAA